MTDSECSSKQVASEYSDLSLANGNCSATGVATTDSSFSQLQHSKGIPQWISRHLTPAPKHKLSATSNELLDELSRPVWLSKKQKVLFGQVSYLTTRDIEASGMFNKLSLTNQYSLYGNYW